jgi:uncharacterized protein (UPF0333 family)
MLKLFYKTYQAMIHREKRGQISVEYMIVVGFIIFVVLLVLGAALLYSSQIDDSIQIRQIEQFAAKVISSAESVKYAGEPSRSTISAYLPAHVRAIQIIGKEIVIDFITGSGLNRVSYLSKVPLEGEISPVFGVKKIRIVAMQDSVNITGLN